METNLSNDELNFRIKQRQIELERQKQELETLKPGSSAYKSMAETIAKTKSTIKEYTAEQNQRTADAQKVNDSATLTDLELKRKGMLLDNPNANLTKVDKDINAVKKRMGVSGGQQGNEAVTYKDWSIDPKTGAVSMPGNPAGYLVTLKDGSQGQYATAQEARKAYLAEYASTTAEMDALKQQVIAKANISQADLAKNEYAWLNGLDYLIQRYTYDTIASFQYGGAKSSKPINDFIKGFTSPSSGTGSGITHTSRGAAKQSIDAYASDLLGRAATKEEEDAFYNDLIKAETTAGSTGLVTAETAMIAANAMRKSLKGTNVDELLKNANGSAVATDIADLQKTAADYGVALTAADALKYVATGIGQKDYLAKQEERIRQTAIALHPQLKDHFMAGGTYKDIADQYKYAKQKKLGVVIDSSENDSDIADAIAKGLSITDFNTALQAKPEWRKSPEAHTMVNDFLNNIAQTWGLG
jgi:hypothetical protein